MKKAKKMFGVKPIKTPKPKKNALNQFKEDDAKIPMNAAPKTPKKTPLGSPGMEKFMKMRNGK